MRERFLGLLAELDHSAHNFQSVPADSLRCGSTWSLQAGDHTTHPIPWLHLLHQISGLNSASLYYSVRAGKQHGCLVLLTQRVSTHDLRKVLTSSSCSSLKCVNTQPHALFLPWYWQLCLWRLGGSRAANQSLSSSWASDPWKGPVLSSG